MKKNAPWVNKIHFITYGHVPDWLNINNSKLNIVNHHDYIPEEYLPTFSSHVIEINLAKIQGLSEKFVYFNDDTFLINKISPDFYFVNETPCDTFISNVITPDGDYAKYLANNLDIICKYFEKKNFYKKHITKVFNIKYGRYNLNNILLLPWAKFTGFKNFHIPQPFLRKTFIEIYSKEEELIHNTSINKFRKITDINQYIFRDWQLASGDFYPKCVHKSSITLSPNSNNINHVIKYMHNKKIKMYMHQ
ncbi:glycosyl transferase [Morganella psychrotolerans]|uniref:glycosyl transferase n=1 Tax=Morganella psychrotolerans TaxID=368603 RepID=UPI0013904008|nr:glycosyl transferase [Morganella psychrotolerans]